MISPRKAGDLKRRLEELYEKYNRRRWVHPDPLEFLYQYEDPKDREVVGLIASSLAYGRVGQIKRSISSVLERMPSPQRFLEKASRRDLVRVLEGFKHRFTTAKELELLLFGVKKALRRYGSLEACFLSGMNGEDILPGLAYFVERIFPETAGASFSLLPHPGRGSACKRLNLYLRWMVRKDGVDPGGWNGVGPSRLIVPLDTHMHRIGRLLGLTDRKQANLRTALEITEAFRMIAPEDPVRYDFCLTRLGIRTDIEGQVEWTL